MPKQITEQKIVNAVSALKGLIESDGLTPEESSTLKQTVMVLREIYDRAIEAESAAEKLIDDFLHEEAEKIRNTLSYAYGCRQAADLIDPYVK